MACCDRYIVTGETSEIIIKQVNIHQTSGYLPTSFSGAGYWGKEGGGFTFKFNTRFLDAEEFCLCSVAIQRSKPYS